MGLAPTVGERVRQVRRRRGLTQRELAERSGVSVSMIRKLEQDGYPATVRMESLHKLAVALRVPTTDLATGPDADRPEQDEAGRWEPVRLALAGHPGSEPEQEPTLEGVAQATRAAVEAILASRYSELQATLPPLLRDADTLVAVSVNGALSQARQLRSQVRQMTAYMMGQTWQFDTATDAIGLAIDDAAADPLTTMAAFDWKCWTMLRQGHLGQTRELAIRWADVTEPRISKATREELSAWGRFLILASTAAARDNRPGEAADALRLAKVAAAGIGKDVIPAANPWQVFGPMTVAMVAAENAMISDQPATVLKVGATLTSRAYPLPRNWNRHRLDVANAHATTRRYPEAVDILQNIRATAPEWLAQQRYACDILTKIISRRRALTPTMPTWQISSTSPTNRACGTSLGCPPKCHAARPRRPDIALPASTRTRAE